MAAYKIRWPVMLLCSILSAGPALCAPRPEPDAPPGKIVLTADPAKRKTPKEFVCRDRVYAYVTVPSERVKEKNILEGRWHRADGRLQETSQLTVLSDPQKTREVGIYVRFEDAKKSIFDEFMFGGDYGEHQSPFHGLWTLAVFWDEKPLAKTTFWVECVD